MYSTRLSWSFSENALSRAATRKREAGEPVLDLTVSNPTVAFAYPDAGMQAALSELHDFTYRPDPFGLEPAREAVAAFYREQGLAVDASRIAFTASTSEAYSLLFKLLCDAEDEVLIPAPSYPLFEYLAALENVRTVPYRLAYDGSWFIDFADLQRQISARTRAIVIVNPNNPTGSFLKKHERESLVEVAREHGMAIVSDEVFMSFEFGGESRRVKTLADEERVLSFSLNGLSKMAGMPQMKLGWIVINGPAEAQRAARERLELILDTYLSVNTPVQAALPALLAVGVRFRSEILTRAVTNLAQMRRTLEGSPVHPLHIEGGWSVILQLPRNLTEEEWLMRLLKHQGVLLQPGFFFDMPSEAYAVASLITRPDEFAEGLRKLRCVTQD